MNIVAGGKMKFRFIGGCGILLTVVALSIPIAAFCAQQWPPDKPYWSGESGGFRITWSGKDLIAEKKGSARVFSVQEFAHQGLSHYKAVIKDPDTGKVPPCSYERKFRLLAVVGSLISFRDEYYASCEKEAHPGQQTRFTTIDLAKPGSVEYLGSDSFGELKAGHLGNAVQMTDIFPESEVYEKLRTDRVVRRTLDANAGGPAPRTLGALLSKLNGQRGLGDNCFLIPGDLLTRFTFHSLANEKVAVRVGLPGDGPCRDELTQLGLLLSVPGHLKASLGQAAKRQAGFLMKDVDRIAGKGETVVALRTSGGTR